MASGMEGNTKTKLASKFRLTPDQAQEVMDAIGIQQAYSLAAMYLKLGTLEIHGSDFVKAATLLGLGSNLLEVAAWEKIEALRGELGGDVELAYYAMELGLTVDAVRSMDASLKSREGLRSLVVMKNL